MARNTLTGQTAVPAGVQISWTALNADGHQFVWQDGCQVLIKNGATGFNLSVPTPATVQGLAIADRTIAISGNEDYAVKIIDPGPYVQSNGMIYLDYDNTDDGEVAVIY